MNKIFETFDLNSAVHHTTAAQIWTEACGPDMAIRDRFVAYNTLPHTGKRQAGQFMLLDGQPAGFVLASLLQGDPVAASPEHGHIDALAVAPAAQQRGLGGTLLEWAEDWLRSQGCTRASLGTSMQPFVPGVPEALGSTSFFQKHGYQQPTEHGVVYDMSADLRDYVTPPSGSKAMGVEVRPARAGDEDAMLGFLRREFPGGWRYEAEELLRAGVRRSDYVLLFSDRGVDGCCLVTFEDSHRPLDRFYMHRLPHPWGQLGAIGVSADRRSVGYGGALLDGGLRHLRDHGVRGCVIDWLVIVGFYAKFGFRICRTYNQMSKRLEDAK